jgi:hypothetical protein
VAVALRQIQVSFQGWAKPHLDENVEVRPGGDDLVDDLERLLLVLVIDQQGRLQCHNRDPAIGRRHHAGLGLLHGRSKRDHLDPIGVVTLLLQFGESVDWAHEPLIQNGIRDRLVAAVPS